MNAALHLIDGAVVTTEPICEGNVAWFRNYYRCSDCTADWTDCWSCTCDDDCPHCGARHMSPYMSDDLTEIIEERQGTFVVLRSPDTAGHQPDYCVVTKVSTRAQAEAVVRANFRDRSTEY